MNAWKPPQFIRDEYEWLAEQQVAAADPAAARAVLVGYGRCVIHGLAEDVTAPSSTVAGLGVETFLAELATETEAVPDAIDAWMQADETAVAEDIVVGLLDLRMQCWAVAEGLERIAKTAGEAVAEILQSVAAVDAATRNFDRKLEEHLDVLSTIVRTPLLKNWRAMLPPAAGYEPLPWWLDGTLERAAIRGEAEFTAMAGLFSRVRSAELRPAEPTASRHGDELLRNLTAALAAAPVPGEVQALRWTLPGTPLRATLVIPPDCIEARRDYLGLDLEDTTGGDAAFAAVGSLSLLNDIPICWSLGGSSTQPDVRAAWPWTGDASGLAKDGALRLVDAATGTEWVAD